jgi:hypothetical protein
MSRLMDRLRDRREAARRAQAIERALANPPPPETDATIPSERVR